MTTETIKANISAREAADAICNLLFEEGTQHHGQASITFYARVLTILRRAVPGEIWPRPAIVRDEPMSDEQVREFELLRMPFGSYSEKQIQDVPLDYLLWLEGEPDFRRQLNRYLRSRQMQQEQGED